MYFNAIKKIALSIMLVWLGVSLMGAGCLQTNCDNEIKKIKDKYGAPEDETRYDSGDYHSVTLRYYTRGESYTFTWSADKSCDESKFTYTPITKPVTQQDIEYVEKHKVLVERRFTHEPLSPISP